MADDIYGARVGRDLVLLDLQIGEYSFVPDLFGELALAPELRLKAVSDAVGRVLPPALACALTAGVAADFNRSPAAAGVPDAPLCVTGRDRLDFAAGLAVLACSYPRRTLAQLVRTSWPAVRVTDGELMRRCRSFAHLLPWAPFPGACLYRAFFLRTFLARGGAGADWVFGVRTWPFRAHCWLECDGVVLNDDPRRVALFAPILVA